MPKTGTQAAATLWRHPDFVKLWTGQTVSKFGSHVTGIALPLTAVLTLAATPAQMGVLAALGSLPVLLIGLLAGAWVDRLRRRPLLIAADVGRALLLLSIPTAVLLHALYIEHLYLVAVLAGTLTVFFDVADPAFLPTIVPPERLVEGNSKLGASGSLAEIAGPSFAGVLVQWLSAPIAIAIDAATFIFSALCLGAIRTPEPRPARQAERQSIGSEIVEGLRVVLRQPVLRALAGTMTTFTFFGNFIGTLYMIYIVRVLHVSSAGVGVLIGLGGVGALMGSLVAEPVVRRFGVGKTLIAAMIFYGCTGLLIPLAGGPTFVAVGMLAIGQLIGDVAIAVYLINDISLRQSVIPSSMLGRANASMQVLERGIGPFGALLAGFLGGSLLLGLRGTILIGVLGVIVSSLWLVFSPVRTLHKRE
ncbi:MAG: MFS transporter, partial [Ktedonobacterales bacterium]